MPAAVVWRPDSYAASRDRFIADLPRVRSGWPSARLASHTLAADGSLSIDWIEAEPPVARQRLLVFTLGEHGIEAYAGAAVLQLFLQEALPRLDPRTTGLLLIHAINPWGMQHLRRVNASNVDLNRTFVLDRAMLQTGRNEGYERLNALFNPRSTIRRLDWQKRVLLLRLAWAQLAQGRQELRRAIWHGQFRHPRGIYYGGNATPDETRVVMDIYRSHLGLYGQVVHFDMHTGYGPRYQMSLVNSCLESRSSRALAESYDYPLVVKATPDEFYEIQGDMVDYVYALASRAFPHLRLYATSFEFGTYGDSTLDIWRGMRAVILENQMYWHGASSEAVRREAERDFIELFRPAEERWWAKAMEDARRAMFGILHAEGYLASGAG